MESRQQPQWIHGTDSKRTGSGYNSDYPFTFCKGLSFHQMLCLPPISKWHPSLCSWVISHVRLSECKQGQCCSLKTFSCQNVFPRRMQFQVFKLFTVNGWALQLWVIQRTQGFPWPRVIRNPRIGYQSCFTFNNPAWEHTVWKLVVERLQLQHMGNVDLIKSLPSEQG